MTVNSFKLKAGKLLLGTAPLNVSAQLTSSKLTTSESVDSTDAIPVLSGEEIPAEDDATYTHALEGTFLQDLAVAGVIEYSWNHMGEWVEFVFVPDIPSDRGCSGEVRIVPLDIGGDVTKPATRPTSDFTWAARGPGGTEHPTFGVYDGVGGDVTEDV